MAVHTFTKPYVVSARGAKQIENALKSPSTRKSHHPKANVTTIEDLAREYGSKN